MTILIVTMLLLVGTIVPEYEAEFQKALCAHVESGAHEKQSSPDSSPEMDYSLPLLDLRPQGQHQVNPVFVAVRKSGNEAGAAPESPQGRAFQLLLMAWSPSTESLLAHRLLDEEYSAVEGVVVQRINLDTDPELEVFLEVQVQRTSREPAYKVRMQRLLAFDYPSLEPLFAKDGTIFYYGEDRVEVFQRMYEFSAPEGRRPGGLTISDTMSGASEAFRLDDPVESRYASRLDAIVANPDYQPKEGIQAIRLVGSDGKPAAEVQVHYEVKTLNWSARSLLDFEHMDTGIVYTDERGYCEVPYSRFGVTLDFRGKRYYPQMVQFMMEAPNPDESWQRQISGEIVPVELTVKQERVAMYLNSRTQTIAVELANLPYEFGIGFDPNPKESQLNNPRRIAELGDVSILVEELTEADPSLDHRSVWRDGKRYKATIHGRNGWNLSLAKSGSFGYSLDIHEAPVADYQPSVALVCGQERRTIFLQKDGGRRYGVINGFAFTSITGKLMEETMGLILHYRVQAESTGSRSLDPIGGILN